VGAVSLRAVEEIFTVNLDGSDLHDSSPGGAVDQDPAWSY
jgi:hypothetical protein